MVHADTINQLEQAVKAGRASAEDKLLLSKNWIIARDFSQALQLLDGISLSNGQQEAVRQILRGLCLERMLRISEANAAYENALQAVPDYSAALLRLGVLAYRMGDVARARQLIGRLIAAGFGSPEAYYYLYLTEPVAAERAQALIQLLALDGPNGPWAALALQHKVP